MRIHERSLDRFFNVNKDLSSDIEYTATRGTFWIGISDVIIDDRWIYTTGQKPITVNNFQPGQPNGHTSQNCVALYSSFHGYWADESCLTRYRFICETDAELKFIILTYLPSKCLYVEFCRVGAQISDIVGGNFWIGISDVIVEDRWIYTTGQTPITVNHFQSGQPNGHTSQNCVALDSSYHGYWNDLNCLTNYPFICETDADTYLTFD
ncbi:unnamed protein product [Mytilus edulis]|uniref:C-type lectin domain-containing protein n=1 Tax=Mytilus edulis TaxID=6550 RepID=A0A8S3SJJ0_MYTED|nr:unnamed protein product [Mytilus edulis]